VRRDTFGNKRYRGGTRGARKPHETLKALRHVDKYPADRDTKDSHRRARRLIEEDYPRFLQELARHESVYRNRNGKLPAQKPEKAREEKPKQEEQEEADEGSVNAVEMVERLIAEFRHGH
jgi:hypothetical protein